jgi:Domain of unknown function (DUF6930)
MERIQASQGEWGRLLESAIRIKQMAPWEWMNENDVFGVQDPETGDIGFVSVMGALGQHVAVAVYLGAAAFVKFLSLQQAPPDILDEYPELLLEIPQLQVSFEDREELEDWERQLLRNLNLKFRGRKAWPRFQSFRPGFMPWRLEPEEIRFLALALQQLEQVAPRVKEDRSFLLGEDPGMLLIRAGRTRDWIAGEWEDRCERISPPPLPQVPFTWDSRHIKKLKRSASRGDIMELDLFMFPGRIGEKGERPQVGYVLLALHAQSNMVFGVEILGVTESIEHMLGRIPGWILSKLADHGLRPKEIHIQSARLFDVLQPAFKELGTKIVLKPALKKLQAAKREMLAFFRKGSPPFRG